MGHETGRGRYAHPDRWSTDDLGNDVMPPLQQKYLEECCLRYPPLMSNAEWARENDVTERTIYNWRSDKRFKKVWREQADDLFAGPEVITPLIQKAYELALNDDGGASVKEQLAGMQEFRHWIGHVTPKQHRVEVVPVSAELAAMSDAELLAAVGSDVLDVEGRDVTDEA